MKNSAEWWQIGWERLWVCVNDLSDLALSRKVWKRLGKAMDRRMSEEFKKRIKP